MLDLIKTLDARLGEPSTWASIAGLLVLAHVNVDPGLWHQITEYGVVAASALGMLLAEIGKKPVVQIAADVMATLATALRAMPAPTPTTGTAPAAPNPAAAQVAA
jgi:hypothetical protein